MYTENESSEIEYQIFNLNFNLNLYSENSQKKEEKKSVLFLKERERGGGKVFKKRVPTLSSSLSRPSRRITLNNDVCNDVMWLMWLM